MSEIKDTGKVWIPGNAKPTFAVRVDEKFYVPGKEDDYSIDYWIEQGALCVDLRRKGHRIARRFSLTLDPATGASLFSGFEKTKHRDVRVALFTDPGVQEYTNQTPGIEDVDRESFWRLTGLLNVDQ